MGLDSLGLVARFRELLAAATARPWKLDFMEMYLFGPQGEMVADTTTQYEVPPAGGGKVALRIRGHGAGLPQRQNGELVAAAVNALPELLAVVEASVAVREDHFDDCACALCAALAALEAAAEPSKPYAS